VALRTSVREVLAGDFGVGLACGLYRVNVAVARDALRRIGITLCGGLAVNAVSKLLELRLVALGALSGHEIRGGGELVHASVTGGAASFAQDGVRAFGESSRFGIVASRALDLGDFGGMREILDRGVAILARKNGVRTRGML